MIGSTEVSPEDCTFSEFPYYLCDLLQVTQILYRSKQQLRYKGSSSVRSSVLIFLLSLWVVPASSASNSTPVDCAHLMAWTAADVPSRKLASGYTPVMR